ncbi:MAG: SDR family NAD(P)-dependent oxidoreductase [Acidimicrobiales bacterium]|nr:SDR family NAD(P)-dependent oxidoreductase [Acidimicrobiales bacterium]
MHPALLDAAIQVLAGVTSAGPDTYLPISIDRVSVHRREGGATVEGWSHVVLHSGADLATRPQTLAADVVLTDASGVVVATVEGLRLKRTDPAALRRLGHRDRHSDWLYEVAWRPLGSTAPAAGQFPSADELATAAAGAVDQLRDAHGLGHYQGLLDELEALSTDYIVTALEQLGVRVEPGASFDAEALPIADQHRRLFLHLLGQLADDGLVARVDDGWQVLRHHHADVGAARHADLLRRYPAGEGELAITRRCGEQLAEALAGTVDPLQLLFPGGSLESAEQMYQLSPFAHFYNSLAGEAVAAAVSGLAPNTRLRVLEIGAGTGGTSAYVLPRLPATQTQYTYTDVSQHFLGRARQKFAAYPFVDYRTLDIEGDLGAQGFDASQYDMVVAANVLHATEDLRRTFGNVAELLAPGGVLVMVEMVLPQRFISISFGLTPGWWKFTDLDLRSEQLLLTRGQWQQFLGDNGFTDPQLVPSAAVESPTSLAIQSIVVAQRGDHAFGAASSAVADQRWLILADGSVGESLARLVDAGGGQAVVVTPGPAFAQIGERRYEIDPTDAAGFERLVAAVAGDELDHVVHLWSQVNVWGSSARERARVPLGSALHLSRALANHGAALRLSIVTRGASTAGAIAPDPEAALLWGFAKSLGLEHPELRPLCVDLDPNSHPSAEELLDAILHAGDEDQLALRHGEKFAARLVAASMRTEPVPFELTFTDRGTLDNLVIVPTARRRPGPGEVEIRVHATGLNFKDVLNVLGMYPGDPGPLGGECAGTVVDVGEGVDGFHIGDRVVALAQGGFRSHATCDAAFVAPLADSVSFADAAGLLIAHVTAEFSLHHLGRLKPGERVLIHAAAGGVGLAAVALAQRLGADVYATAGSEAKRGHLRSLGVSHVYDSRNLDFAAQIRADTDGSGVDVVLNSLAGDFVEAGLGLLRDGGRFLEIGKSDHLTADRAAALGRDIQYHIIDWGESARAEPQLIRSMIDGVLSAVTMGLLRPLPVRTFDMSDAQSAFRFMAQARHTGKVVVVQPEAVAERAADIRGDATYLISGGLSGLGLLTAQHLASRGARHLVLLGRRAPSPEADHAIAELESSGVHVAVCTGDVSIRADVQRALDLVHAEMPPLRGVFHSAGALDDAAIGQMSWEQVTSVLAAKADGALLLDELTTGTPLDHFVLYASIASLLGARGQANHAAANAFLDALAHRRVAAGYPALSIDWGAWSEVGAAAERGVDKRVGEQGIGVITPEEGLAVLDLLLDRPSPQVGVSPVQWPVLLQRYGAGGPPPYFAEVVDASHHLGATVAAPAVVSDLSARVAAASPERRTAMVLDFVRDQSAHVLALSASQVGDRVPLSDLGLDSLMAVELRNVLGAGLGLTRPIPATLVFDYPTVEAISSFLTEQLLGSSAADISELPSSMPSLVAPVGHASTEGALVSSLLDDLENLTDEEIDAQLARRNGS